jgi:hypothetical protein
MAVLELVQNQPDWLNALGVAMTRPPGVPERRGADDPWQDSKPAEERPRRISDDLAWLRQAMDDPADCGLEGLVDSAAVGAWVPDPTATERLCRLRDRRVLDAAGFLLHEETEGDELSAA